MPVASQMLATFSREYDKGVSPRVRRRRAPSPRVYASGQRNVQASRNGRDTIFTAAHFERQLDADAHRTTAGAHPTHGQRSSGWRVQRVQSLPCWGGVLRTDAGARTAPVQPTISHSLRDRFVDDGRHVQSEKPDSRHDARLRSMPDHNSKSLARKLSLSRFLENHQRLLVQVRARNHRGVQQRMTTVRT